MWLGALDESSDFRFDDPRLSTTLEGLAEVYWRRGKFDKAEPLCKQILQISETLLGQEHTDVALAANNLALLCDRQGKYSEAAMLYQQALAINEKILGRNHPDVIGIRECHAKARQMAQKQIEMKLERA
jgi:tetratricopeptide (TPR) repeat protein